MKLPLLFLGLALAAPASAQVITGRVVDAEGGQPVPQARVTVLGADDRAAGRVLTDATGRFSLTVRSAGLFRLRAERTGYPQTLTPPVDVGPRDTVEVEVRVSSEALRMEALTVTARRQPPRRAGLEAAGFYARERLGLGRFLYREEIERNSNMNVVQVLDRLPGTTRIRVGRTPFGEGIIFERSSSAGAIIRAQTGQPAHCLPAVYVDGTPMFYDETGLNALLQPESLEAVEVYSGSAQVPAEYNNNASCGVILLWTKKER